MEKKHKVMQVYAVIVCVVTIITIIISATSLISALIDRSDPLYADRFEINLASFENFKMDALKATQKDQAYIPDDQILLKMYDSAKEDKIKSVMHQTNRTIIVSSLITGLALILFITHFLFMKKLGKE